MFLTDISLVFARALGRIERELAGLPANSVGAEKFRWSFRLQFVLDGLVVEFEAAMIVT